MKTIIFICTGNTCRSPMAKAVAEKIFEGTEFSFKSRGISVFTEEPASKNAVIAVKAYNADLSGHISRQITEQDVKDAYMLITMTRSHKDYLSEIFPSYRKKIYMLKYLASGCEEDICDPYGGTQEIYDACLKEIYTDISNFNISGGKKMIAIGCDHTGIELKNEIINYLTIKGFSFIDFGTNSKESVDYPVYAKKIGKAINGGSCETGILICGTGIGVSIAANKIEGIRAALCHDVFSAKATRLHNDANVLVLGARVIGAGLAIEILKAFLSTDFSNEERHINRIAQLEED